MGKKFSSALSVPAARPRTAVPESQVRKFAKRRRTNDIESLGTQSPSVSSSQASAKRAKTKLVKKKTILRVSGRELRRLGVYFPVDLARDLAVHCAGEGIELSAFVVAAVRRELTRK